MIRYLEVADGFIRLTAETSKAGDFAQIQDLKTEISLPNQVKLKLLDNGVLQVLPENGGKQALVISCAIHGNETAPIEIVSNLISQIATGAIKPGNPVLFILGNPESMKIAKRFMSLNMNRLFAGAHENYPVDEGSEYEINRAKQLESHVRHFYETFTNLEKIHLDLHTAIKPSYHKTFAIRPLGAKTIDDNEKKLLLAMGIEAVLQHNKPSTTFSYFSSHEFKAQAYTLELGKVKPFGENIAEDFAAAVNCLKCLVQGTEWVEYNPANLIEYKVVAEIIRNSEDFKFYVSDDVENFTPFPQGYLIAEDYNYNYRVAFSEEAVVFPNPHVPVGQRVAVMVARKQSH